MPRADRSGFMEKRSSSRTRGDVMPRIANRSGFRDKRFPSQTPRPEGD